MLTPKMVAPAARAERTSVSSWVSTRAASPSASHSFRYSFKVWVSSRAQIKSTQSAPMRRAS